MNARAVAWATCLLLAPAFARAQSTTAETIAHFAARGPFSTMSFQGGPGGAFTFFVPVSPVQSGRRFPVITWGNGTGNTPADYQALLDHYASHGFVVVAAQSQNTGSGAEILQGFDFVVSENSIPGSPFFQTIDARGGCSAGHSQGAFGAINAAAAAPDRLLCTAPIESANGNLAGLRAPLLLTTGTRDTVVPPERVTAFFRRIQQLPTAPQAILANVIDATHFTPVSGANPQDPGGLFRPFTTAFFAANLLHDADAIRLFFGPAGECGICTDPRFAGVQRNFSEDPAPRPGPAAQGPTPGP